MTVVVCTFKGKNLFRCIEVEAETAENALTKLEELCKTYKAKKYIIIDPTSFDWW